VSDGLGGTDVSHAPHLKPLVLGIAGAVIHPRGKDVVFQPGVGYKEAGVAPVDFPKRRQLELFCNAPCSLANVVMERPAVDLGGKKQRCHLQGLEASAVCIQRNAFFHEG
jgi:hypothetical protein